MASTEPAPSRRDPGSDQAIGDFLDKLSGRWLAPIGLTALGALLFLPLLGSFGLWDPQEVRIADIAKEVATSTGWTLPRQVTKPPLPYWLIAAGFRTLGVGDLSGRLPVALTSIAALVASFYCGLGLLGRRGALLGTFALATSPAMFLAARQLGTNAAPVLALALTMGGLAHAWRETRSLRRLVHSIIALGGLLIGYYASGLIGGAVVLTAVGLAVLIGGGSPKWRWSLLGATVIAWVAIGIAWWQALPGGPHAGQYQPLLGGTVRTAAHQIDMVSLLKRLGFGLFPWVALAPLGLVEFFSGCDDEEPRRRAGRLALIIWAGLAYLTATFQAASLGESNFAALLPLALLAGDYLERAIASTAPARLAGFAVALAAVVVGHDLFMQPEQWVGAHILEGIKWPSPLVSQPGVLLGYALAWGALSGLGLAWGRPRGPLSRPRLLGLGAGLALAGALTTTLWIVPEVSKHLSYKGLFTKYRSLGGSDGELGQYRVPGHGASYYNAGGKTVDLPTIPKLFEFLAKPTRTFVVIASEDLAPIDQHAKSQRPADTSAPTPEIGYYVVDDSNSHFLLLSNRLGAGEADLNPLRRNIVAELGRKPAHEVHADFEGKVELVGYDLPPELERGRRFTITLYYKVNAPMPGSQKVFLHFDGPGTRFNGDHVPLDGRFPTNYWVPGFYVIDNHQMEPDRATAPSGWYQIYTGLFMGDRRLKVVSGPSDGENRVKLGAVRVK